MADNPTELVAAPVELIIRRVYLICGRRVMLDTHLAELFEVPTFRLSEAVKRNSKHFMFQLTAEGPIFDIAICDVKANRPWRPADTVLCL